MSRRILISFFVAIFSIVGIGFGTLGIALLFSVDLPDLQNLSVRTRSLFVFLFLVVFLISWLLFYFEKKAEVGELKARLDKKRGLQISIDELAILRSEGVNKYYAKTPNSVEEFAAWVGGFEEWEGRVSELMKKRFTDAVARSFSELGAISLHNFTQISTNPEVAPKHERALLRMVKELQILETIIKEGSVLQKETDPSFWEAINYSLKNDLNT